MSMNMRYFRKQQKQSQAQIDKQEEAKTQLLKSQINSMFVQFGNIIKYLKSDEPEQQFLLTLNDSAVALLKLLASTCADHVDDKETNVLISGWNHFNAKKAEIGTDGRIIQQWLDYSECALLGKELNQLQISQITIDAAHKNMEQGGLRNFLDGYVGANHKSQDIVKDAKTNRAKYKSQNQQVIANKKQSYEERQAMIQCPEQNKMYDVAGGAQNYQFGSALYHPTSKYYDQRPRDDQKQQQNKTAMDQDDNDNQKEYPWLNAYVIKPPAQKITRGNKAVNINYPYPCKIVPGKSWHNGQVLGVVYAKPNDDLRVKIEASNLERDTVKVSDLETRFMTACNLSGDKALGYESILEQQNSQFQ